MSIRPAIPSLVLLAAMVTLSGCASTPGADSADVGVITREASGENGSNMALTTGVLVVENGCVRLDTGVVPVFPAEDVSWDGTTLTHLDTAYGVGDTISLGGGEYSESGRADIVPEECGGGPAWGVARGVDTAL